MQTANTAREHDAVAALVVATAPGFGDDSRSALWREVAGHPLIAWTLDAVAHLDGLASCAIVVAPERLTATRMLVESAKLAGAVDALPVTDYSWRGALSAFDGAAAGVEWMIILDASLPLVTPACLRAGLATARATGVAIASEPVKETLKLVRDGLVMETPPRESLRRLLSPVVLQRAVLRRVIERYATTTPTPDDLIALTRLADAPLVTFDAGYPTLRATNAEDMGIIETLLRQRSTEKQPS